MRYRLRTLLIVAAILPPILAVPCALAYRGYTARVEALRRWQEIAPNTRLVRPTWWIFESPIQLESQISRQELEGTANP